MPTEEYLIQQKVEGEDRVRRLTEAIRADEAALARHIASLREFGTANVAADADVQRLTASILHQSADLARTQGALDQTNRAIGRGGSGVLAFARTLDDAKQFQYGFSQGIQAISNNLVEIHPALGLAAIAVGVLASHWDEFQSLVKGTRLGDAVEELTGYYRRLAESIGLARTEAQKLTEAGKAASAETAKVVGTEQEERGRRFTETVKQQGNGADVEADVLRRYREANPNRSAADQAHDVARLQEDFARALKGDEAAIGHVTPYLSPEFAQAQDLASPGFKAQVKALEEENEAVRKAAEARNAALDAADKEQLAQHKAWLDARVKETAKALENETKAAAGKGIGAEFIKGKLVGTGQYTEAQAAEVAAAANAQLGAEAAARARVKALGGAVPDFLKSENVRAEFLSASDVGRRAVTGALGGRDGIPEEQLGVAKEQRDLLKKIADKGADTVLVD